jgi:hypothetical protein
MKRAIIKNKRQNKNVGVKILPPNGCSSFINHSLRPKPDPDKPAGGGQAGNDKI